MTSTPNVGYISLFIENENDDDAGVIDVIAMEVVNLRPERAEAFTQSSRSEAVVGTRNLVGEKSMPDMF